MYEKYIKRIFDIVFSIIFLLILFPLFIITGIICLICNGGIIYKQDRVGLNKKSFVMYKFKSLNDLPGNNYERSNNLTRFIRQIGLDELPQFINILKGDMSFVGPRPFIKDEPLPIRPKRIIYKVKPGFTGMAQSHGRRQIGHKQRLEYDEYYVKNISFILDLKIILRTFTALFN